LAPAARGGIPVEMRIPTSERTHQKLNELLTHGVADGDARAELLKLAVRKIVEETLEAEVAEAVGRGYYENGAEPGRAIATAIIARACAPRKARSSTGCPKWPIAPSRSCPACGPAWRAGRRSSSSSLSRCASGV
jgi:hypothetical protein